MGKHGLARSLIQIEKVMLRIQRHRATMRGTRKLLTILTSISRPWWRYTPTTRRLSMATGRRGRHAIVGILIIPGSALLRGLILSARLLPRRLRIKATWLIRLLLMRSIGARLVRKTIGTWLTTRAHRPGVRLRGKGGSGPPSRRLRQLSSSHGR